MAGACAYDNLHNTLWNKVQWVTNLTDVYQDVILKNITTIFKDVDSTYSQTEKRYVEISNKINTLISNISQKLPNDVSGFCKSLTLFQNFWKKEIEMIQRKKTDNNSIIANILGTEDKGKIVRKHAADYLKGYKKCQKAEKEAEESFIKSKRNFEGVYEKTMVSQSLKSFNKSSEFNIDDLSSNEILKKIESDYVKSLETYQEKNSEFLEYSPEGMGDKYKGFFKDIGSYIRNFEDIFKGHILSSCTTTKAYNKVLCDYQEEL